MISVIKRKSFDKPAAIFNRRTPWRSNNTLGAGMFDTFFDGVFDNVFDGLLLPAGRTTAETRYNFITETIDDNKLRLAVAVPGSKASDVDVSVDEEDYVKITARRGDTTTLEKTYVPHDGYDAQSARASVEDGMLTIEFDKLPVAPKASSKNIEVKQR